MSQHDARRGFADDGTDFAQQADVIGEFQILRDGRVKRRAEHTRRLLGFRQSFACRLFRPHLHRTTASIAEVQVVKVPTALLQLKQRSGSDELDVVRVREDGENGGHVVR